MVSRGLRQSGDPHPDRSRVRHPVAACRSARRTAPPRFILDCAHAPLRAALPEKRNVRLHALRCLRDGPDHPGVPGCGLGLKQATGMKGGFIERSIASLLATSEYAATAEQMALAGGALQKVDPRVKVAGLFGL